MVIPDAGHMVDMQAAERCDREIRAFVQQVEAFPMIAKRRDFDGRE